MSTVAGINISDNPDDWRNKADAHRDGQPFRGGRLAPRPVLADVFEMLAARMEAEGETAEEALIWMEQEHQRTQAASKQ